MNSIKSFALIAKMVTVLLASILLSASSCSDDNSTSSEGGQQQEGLKEIVINTPDNQAIKSKDSWIDGSEIKIIDEKGDVEFSGTTMIKGHGNVNWYEAPKKAYAIKFARKEALLGLPKGKTWVLLGNWYDKTLLKTDIAFYMGREMSLLDYTPRCEFVKLSINGENLGIYQLVEKLRITEGRVNDGNDGFLLEIDAKSSRNRDITFSTPHLEQPVNIKDPDITADSEDYQYIKDYVTAAEEALYADNFTDETEGYRRFFDVESFVEWYIINEIAKNNDAAFYSSCYMHLKRGGKLEMGPLWDFDWAFGGTILNNNDKPEGFWIGKAASWYVRLFKDPAFASRVRSRFMEYYLNREMIYDRIDLKANELAKQINENNSKWGTIGSNTADKQKVIDAYLKKVEDLKEWIETRMEWIKDNIGSI